PQSRRRATGITAFMENGGALEDAALIAAHESPRTTKLYDRTEERIGQEMVERHRFKRVNPHHERRSGGWRRFAAARGRCSRTGNWGWEPQTAER
ncbi:MAG: hypothetical protein RLY93_05685, partial [Sumerlaeia bacterium]